MVLIKSKFKYTIFQKSIFKLFLIKHNLNLIHFCYKLFMKKAFELKLKSQILIFINYVKGILNHETFMALN